MNRKHRRRKEDRRRAHQGQQEVRKYLAELGSREEAQRKKKGKAGVIKEMERAGYVPDGRGGWKRLSKQRRAG